jgi:hypothetical protein
MAYILRHHFESYVVPVTLKVCWIPAQALLVSDDKMMEID